VDEVLAVGDVEFQRKCLGKMRDVAGQGRTVLFVSHNMAAGGKLCPRALCFDRGQIRMNGDVRSVVSDYLSNMEQEVLEYLPKPDPLRTAEVRRIVLCDQKGTRLNQVTTADSLNLRIELFIRERRHDLRLAFSLNDFRQDPIFASCPADDGVGYPTQLGFHEFDVAFPGPLLMPQRYSITVSIYSSLLEVFHVCSHALVFDVVPAPSQVYSADPNRSGMMQIHCHWRHRTFGEANYRIA